MAPNIQLVFTPDSIDDLQNELDRLNDLIDDTLDRSKESKNTISDRLDSISDFAHTASDNASELSDIMGDWTDGTIDSANDLTIADTIDHLETITSSGEDILDVVTDGIDGLEASIHEIASATGIGEDGFDSLSDAVKYLRESLRDAREGLEKIRQALKDISNAPIIDDPNRHISLELLYAGTKQLTKALEQCGDAAIEIAAILAAGNIGDEERLLIQQAFGQLTDGFQASAFAIGRIFKGVIVMAEGINWEQAKEGVKQVLAAVNDAFGISDKLYQSMESLQNAFSHLADMGENCKTAWMHWLTP